jgi:hypothetical protein
MLKRSLLSLSMLLLIGVGFALPARADAQSRIALVIGNSSYQKVTHLANPAHDAEDVAAALTRLGFEVKTVIDADFEGLRRALLEFGRRVLGADMAVFYFAGHGVEIDGNNWLLPTDVDLKSDADARTEAIGLQSVMQTVATARTLGLVILDACRNNPFQSSMKRIATPRSVHLLGLAPVEPADNVLVAYAARDGTVAADGAGRNSPYAGALLKHIETAGLEVDFLFRNVRDDVMAATNDEQQPFVYGSLSSDAIYLKPPPASVAAGDPAPTPDAGEIAWSFLRATNDVSTLARFVDRFPESSHLSDAKVRIASLAAGPAPSATDIPPPSVHPVTFADTELEQAEKALARRFVRDTAAIQQAWDIIKETKDHKVIRHFVDRFPGKTRQVTADTRLVTLGQKPITVSPAPFLRPLEVDDAVLAMAATDPAVLQCFQGGDQGAAACQTAFERFPDISRFAGDIRFTFRFCQALGSPLACIPAVITTWNFPSRSQGSGATNTAGGGTPGGGTGGGTPPGPIISHRHGRPPGDHGGSSGKFHFVPHPHVTAAHSNAGSNVSDAGVKATTTSAKPTVHAPAVHAPAVRAPKVTPPPTNVPHVNVPNIRVPNLAIH